MTHTFSIRVVTSTVALGITTLAVAACSPDRLVRSDPPSNIVAPSAVTNADAAIALYNGAASLFAAAFGGGGNSGIGDGYVRTTATATDELATPAGDLTTMTDLRNTAAVHLTQENLETSTLYTLLQTARISASQARQGLQRYGDVSSTALIGRMYAFEAYSTLMLAEYFCDGIPLSQTSLDGKAVLSPGLGTDELLSRAVALFDSAITSSADSARLVNMEKVGKGRALLDQGKFADAATAVTGIPLTFVYAVPFGTGSVQAGGQDFTLWNSLVYPYTHGWGGTPFMVLDYEGGNGLPWSTDPRIPLVASGGLTYPDKYTTDASPIRLADGIEAQLIRAEADFQANGTAWLGLLNDLRANCTSASGCAPVPGITTGTLPPLPDSGTAVGRIREIMAERGYWLYLTGHRQEDLRRLLRPPYSAAPYNFTQSTVYPSGLYTNPTYTGPTANYGNDVVALPALDEEKYNPKYHGCFDLNP
jgi:hypothetical protein